MIVVSTASIVDWISFTIPSEPINARSHQEMYDRVGQAQRDAAPGLNWDILNAPDWKRGAGRAPYKECLRSESLGLAVYWSPVMPHILHEFSGTGCRVLRENGMLIPIIQAFGDRLTRLDLATDFVSAVSPVEFVSAGLSERIAARGSFTSSTGDTEYVGSAKSEKFARVYRYAPPHPRSDCLRVEHVLRRDYARTIAPYLVEYGVSAACVTVGKTFAWKHDLWQHAGKNEFAWVAPRNNRKTSGTERWLITQAASAFRRLVADGTIANPYEWVAQHFLGSLDEAHQLPLELPGNDT